MFTDLRLRNVRAPRRRRLLCLAASVMTAPLAACGATSTSSDEAIATFALTSRAGINTYAVVPDQLRLASAGYFRDLAVRAASGPIPAVQKEARDALYSEKGVHRSLSADTQREILPYLAALDAASARGDRAAIAASSLEAVRLLCLDLSGAAEKQGAFMLIDYAQLAVGETLRAPAPDWSAAERTLSLAESHRRILADRRDVMPDTRFDADFDTLAATVDRHDRDGAVHDLAAIRRSFDGFRARSDGALPDQALASANPGGQ